MSNLYDPLSENIWSHEKGEGGGGVFAKNNMLIIKLSGGQPAGRAVDTRVHRRKSSSPTHPQRPPDQTRVQTTDEGLGGGG